MAHKNQASSLSKSRSIEEMAEFWDTRELISVLQTQSGQVRRSAAKALVAIYRRGDITGNDKQLILAQRDKIITKHRDGISHNDSHSDNPHYDKLCGSFRAHNDRARQRSHHDDPRTHTDYGSGVDFPL